MRRTDYLLQRPGSQNWRVRLQEGGKSREQSLGTPDRAVAEIRAASIIADHKAKLLANRPRFVTSWWHELEPGRKHVAADGGEIIATERELIHLDAAGTVIKTTPNGAPQYTFPTRLKEPSFELFDRERVNAPPTKNGDDDLIETYLKHANVSAALQREARGAWEMFKSLCPNVKLKDATRDDGRKLVAHYQGQGLKSATVLHKVQWLAAACNLAIKENRLKFNPFSGIVQKNGDALRRAPMDDDDMRLIRANLDRLSKSDRLLLTVLATTGMRLGEAFQIKSEATERGVRYVVLGTKTEQSLRRVPLPAKLLPLLPATIKGPLFPDDNAHAASTRLNPFLRGIGITDPAKVVHSFRHRAQDRLRAAECPSDIREAILGHEKKTVAAGYGEGFAVPVLKRWIDKIGF